MNFDSIYYYIQLIYFFFRFCLLRDNAKIKKLLIIIKDFRLLIVLVS